jgi:ribosomal protein S18 acetylase RimI-like enzyme
MAASPQPREHPIALATDRDAAQIASIARSEIEYGLPWGWTALRVARSIADPATNVAVLRAGDAIRAFGIMKYRDETAHLLLLAVHAAHRRRGIGSAVLVWLEDVARTAGIALLGVEARADNPAALAFYRHHGFAQRVTVPGMYSGKVDGVRLSKALIVRAAPPA